MITNDLVERLWCPTCQSGELQPSNGATGAQAQEGEFRCMTCGNVYPVKSGIPFLFPHGVMTTEEWKVWEAHLEQYHARTVERLQHPDRMVTRWGKRSRPHKPFADFIGVEQGTLLDVGCGPGKFRRHFDPARVRYFGLDPLISPDLEEFPFVQAIGEYIPFKDGTFTDIVVMAAIDHFRDLERFFTEVQRVLTPNGRLHISQHVHGVTGPISLVKMLGHRAKDAIEEWQMRDTQRNAPKHLAEFTSASLQAAAARHFTVQRVEQYSTRWYTPTQVFITLRALARPAATATSGQPLASSH